MTDQNGNDAFNKKVSAIDVAGTRRFGPHWQSAMDGIRKAAPAGISRQEMDQVASLPDPEGALFVAGMHANLNASDAGDKEAEKAYNEWRREEKDKHFALKGRR
jgi:hypothetical protein